MLNEAFIEIHGKREVLVDGCNALLQYDDDEILLLLGKKKLRICGSRLLLEAMSETRIGIVGTIKSVEFL